MTAPQSHRSSFSAWMQACLFAAGLLLAVVAGSAWPVGTLPVAAVYPAWMTPEAAYAAALEVPGWRPMRVQAGLFPVVFLAPEGNAAALDLMRFGRAWMVIAADGGYGCTPGLAEVA